MIAGYDVLCCPAICLEGGPTVALEAQACGTPVIGTRIGGLAELVREGIDGALVTPGEWRALSRLIGSIVADPAATVDLWRRNLPQPRTMDEVASDYLRLYAESLAVNGRQKIANCFHELGAPNPFAAEEYQTVRSRLDGLETQRADLTDAIAKTRALIEQLNVMISTQFRSTFTALETAFDGQFRQLFSGGFARLSLTDPEDLSATGIEIVARPPGKKAQPLSMLSGGERALTAVALLFAMLEVHPVPFCVLDEVDAALDEANIGRFAEALRGLADQTQIIVITHNRGTIESADALYGVTVGDDAVSRVISLRLEEAREMADQVTRRNAAATAGSGS